MPTERSELKPSPNRWLDAYRIQEERKGRKGEKKKEDQQEKKNKSRVRHGAIRLREKSPMHTILECTPRRDRARWSDGMH